VRQTLSLYDALVASLPVPVSEQVDSSRPEQRRSWSGSAEALSSSYVDWAYLILYADGRLTPGGRMA
jgi:hypothetical protein